MRGEVEDDGQTLGGSSLWSNLDLGDGGWQPKGVDSFICDARARRGKLADHGAEARARAKHSALHGMSSERRQGLAARLGAPADWGAGFRACLGEPLKHDASESEDDEMAPVAAIPRVPQGLVETPSVSLGSDDFDDRDF